MPPRSVCLNVFTSSLGEAVRDDGVPTRHPIMERRDSAQSGMSFDAIATFPMSPPHHFSMIANAQCPDVQPRRHVLLAPSHGFHRESQLLHELQAYVLPPLAAPCGFPCRNPTGLSQSGTGATPAPLPDSHFFSLSAMLCFLLVACRTVMMKLT
jgi:hypothetical protein